MSFENDIAFCDSMLKSLSSLDNIEDSIYYHKIMIGNQRPLPSIGGDREVVIMWPSMSVCAWAPTHLRFLV